MPEVTVPEGFEGRYSLPLIEHVEDSAEQIRRKQERVRALCAERNAILLGRHARQPHPVNPIPRE